MVSIERRRWSFREKCDLLDEPESDQARPDHSVGEWKESHQSSSKDTDDVTDSHHKETSVLPSSSDETGDKERDDLEGSTSTVKEGGVDGGETQSLDDRSREVGEDTVGHTTSEHGDG